MNLPGYAINFLPSLKGLLSKHVTSELSLAFPVKVYCYLFVKADEDMPMDWYVKRACEMVRVFLNEEEASIELVHHVRTVSSRKEMFCVQMDLSLDFLLNNESSPELKRNADEETDLVLLKRPKLD
uniref:tRNA wybutosine-synthesizing protein 2 homolog n=1 Tax=Angiostrongylus cantonensis TaxID=6313 RepID=A0A0K0DCR7_ANGCA